MNSLANLMVPVCFTIVLAGCFSPPPKTKPCCASLETASPASTSTNCAAEGWDQLVGTPMLDPEARPALALDHQVTCHDGRVVEWRTLLDRPTAISFAYSRCVNPRKCPRVVRAMAALRDDLERTGLLGKVRLLLVTYDPAHDTPAVLRSFAKANGLQLDENVLFVRPGPDPEHQLFRELQAPASFNEGGVAIHGIQLLLLDKQGHLARTYHTLLWDNVRVASDLAQLARE